LRREECTTLRCCAFVKSLTRLTHSLTHSTSLFSSVGVYLNDILEENSGNFTVYPGTHMLHADWFKSNPPEALLNEQGYMKAMPTIQRPPGVQIKAKAGDVIIAHYLLAHSIASNVSPNIRYALYFRITSTKQAENTQLRLQQPFLDWQGIDTP
jgi:ectoine hydroxylase-related dioxygenase (phytanoyl-CoA dioxygenase family)